MNQPTRPLTRAEAAGRRYLDLGHYLLAPYASIEQHTQRVIVIDPTLSEPTLLVRPGSRRATRKTTLALAVPNLDAVTRELAVALTNCAAPFFGVREWTREMRRNGDGTVTRMPIVAHDAYRAEPIRSAA